MLIILALVLLLRSQTFGLNTDGALLLSFKHTILSDPFGVMLTWNSDDDTPCSWKGITCAADAHSRVTGLSLPNSGLLGPIPTTLGMIENLESLDLSNNSFNGSIPSSLFPASSKLQLVDFSNNLISGGLPELVGKLGNLRLLNLSNNVLSGRLPENLPALINLKEISLSNNYFFGPIPGGFSSVQVLDLSSNLFNGSLPPDFGGDQLTYLNVSFNRISGEISPEFSEKIPENATLDLSFNSLTGRIPESNLFFNQDKKSYAGNPELCGEPLRNPCRIPSSAGILPSATSQESPPAIAAIPKDFESGNAVSSGGNPTRAKRTGLRLGTILGIVAADVAGVGIIVMVFLYVYKLKRRKTINDGNKEEAESSARNLDWASSESSSEEDNWLIREWTCLKPPRQAAAREEEEEEQRNSEFTRYEIEHSRGESEVHTPRGQEKKTGALVTVDGEQELELETLLKASAYILGASGSSIMYKAVLDDGTTLAVRRVGENGVERFRDFQNQVRVIAKLVHPNLVRIRGFYWGADEKLIIYDYVSNGNLASSRYRKAGSSPYQLPWELRLKIAKGVARGLCYIHEKKQVHGNLKPNNILLGSDMEPKIGDFGLQRLVSGDNSSKVNGSARYFSSKRSTASRDSFQDFASGATPSPSPSTIGVSPYHAPESLRSLKPSPKWDVFSFGVVLLELLTGKVVASEESGPALAVEVASTSSHDDKYKVLRMADASIRGEMEGKEDALLALLRLGYSCISPVPQKRPSAKETLQALEKFPCFSFSSS